MTLSPVRYQQTRTLDVPREALWKYLSDTDALNRETGLPPAQFRFTPRTEGGSTVKGTMRVGGYTLRYDEHPYCWLAPACFSVRRTLDNSPLTEIALGITLEGTPTQTTVTAWFQVQPRFAWARVLAQKVATGGVIGLLRACEMFTDYLLEKSTTPYPRHAVQSPPHRERLSAGIQALTRRGVSTALAERLRAFLADAPLEIATGFRPHALADDWGMPRRAVLSACLQGVKAGLLELHWRLLCPACQGAGERFPDLGKLPDGEAHCPSCAISYGPEFDRNVEICFSVAPTIRADEKGEGEATYCIGGPGRARQVLLQWLLEPHETRHWTVPFPAGEYRLFSPQLGIQTRLLEQSLTLENPHPYPVLWRVEALAGRTDVATAAEVTSLQAFRDIFTSETLAPNTQLAVRQITILFTDLKGSTHFYATRGDAPSYAAVCAHFEFLRRVIGEHGGCIVKTIGDAVMAAFPDPTEAVAACYQIQREAPRQPDAFVIKMGLCSGSAIAVNTNGILDYFGQTVNRAARIQQQSEGGDIVLPDTLLKDASLAPLLATCRIETLTVHLRGDDAPMLLARLQVEMLS